MALQDRQILAHLEQLGSDVANYIFDEVKAYRARLARGARRVLKGHILKGGTLTIGLQPLRSANRTSKSMNNAQTHGSHYA